MHSTKFYLITLFVFLIFHGFSQENCKVLKPEISTSYIGKCKNGLAHGKGIASGVDKYEGQFVKGYPDGKGLYTYASGNVYSGEWKEGKRNGIGKLTVKTAGSDSIQDGVWKDDKFIGPKPKEPEIIYKSSVDRYSVQKTNVEKNRVQFKMLQSGTINLKVKNVDLISSSGQEFRTGNLVGFDQVVFPATVKISYITPNKLATAEVNAIFEIRIFEPGDWVIELHN
jgi:hypothetical protein